MGPYKVDALFPGHHVAVEIDGYRPHYTPASFEADLKRQNDLGTTYGLELIRFAWRTVREEPMHVAARIALATSPGTTRA